MVRLSSVSRVRETSTQVIRSPPQEHDGGGRVPATYNTPDNQPLRVADTGVFRGGGGAGYEIVRVRERDVLGQLQRSSHVVNA